MHWHDVLGNNDSPALADGLQSLSYRELLIAIVSRSKWLKSLQVKTIALDLDNGIEWVLFDMACTEAGIICIPLPPYFTESQRQHALTTAGVDLILTSTDSGSDSIRSTAPTPFDRIYAQTDPAGQHSKLIQVPFGTNKITFTSGSTGTPKGVCLNHEHLLITARALLAAIEIERPVHLTLLPLATLLENIAGVYAPLLAGGTVYVPNNSNLGFTGSRLQSPELLCQAISQFQPDTLILVPELLLVLVRAVASGWQPPSSLQFIAVGGARVSRSLMTQAYQMGLPVYQGYGLSECASVVALNTPRYHCHGSIGRPLPHVSTSIRNHELVVSGNCFLGYLDDPDSWYPSEVMTGDILRHDANDYLWFEGRRSNQLVSSFGRNINPEWPESELLSGGILRQAVVLGDSQPHCIAIISAFGQLSENQLSEWLKVINQRLPDYAQIKQCLLLDKAMTTEHKLYTDNGRPNRSAIARYFAVQIEQLYQQAQQEILVIDETPAVNTKPCSPLDDLSITSTPQMTKLISVEE